jgi:hypothetical protein
MRRTLIALIVLLGFSLLTAARVRADSPDFSLFSRGWSVHKGLMVIAADGAAVFEYQPLGPTNTVYTVTFTFTSVSDDGTTAYGTVVGSNDAGLGRGGIYGWIPGADVVFTLASAHTAYLQQSGTMVFLCSSGWLDERPVPPCGV